jgi:hypothetical protein
MAIKTSCMAFLVARLGGPFAIAQKTTARFNVEGYESPGSSLRGRNPSSNARL